MTAPPIDAQTGIVRTDGGEEFGPRLSRCEFLLRDGADVTPGVANGPFATWSIRRAVGGEPFVIEATFHGDALWLLSLTIDRDLFARGWRDWSEGAEERRRVEHDRWLRDACGIPPRLSGEWGRLESVVDQRTGWSAIAIRFEEVTAQPTS